ncbi:hypothetical protein BJF78_36200 [Pseudonocardia sp. CNS-139]|nr:hypothetical protein BJF78_36200 [Pseudonocardia sp. CNS-139]
MLITDRHVARIPAGNLRVPLSEFVAVWTAAEQANEDGDWYAGGVVVTCRWLACSTVELNGRRFLASAPVSGRRRFLAHEELIEAEYLAAEMLDQRQPQLLESRPGWCEGIRATLRWAWRRSGPPPCRFPSTRAGRPSAEPGRPLLLIRHASAYWSP